MAVDPLQCDPVLHVDGHRYHVEELVVTGLIYDEAEDVGQLQLVERTCEAEEKGKEKRKRKKK